MTNGRNGTGSVADVTQNGVSVLDGTVAKIVADANVQSDWNESDSTDDAYIKNNPSIPTKTSDLTNDSNFASDSNYVHTDNNFTSTLKTKLDGIASGAEVNVQANWNETSSSSDAYIQNKPTIPSVSGITVTLAVADWANSTQTVTATGVTASNNVVVSPTPASTDDYVSAGILCTAQASNSLTFTCTTTPSTAISVNVVILS